MKIPSVAFLHGLINVFASYIAGLVSTIDIRDIFITKEWKIFDFESGKSALLFVLKIFSQTDAGKKIVIMPSYTCFSVASAVVKSGLQIRLCEIDKYTLNYNLDDLEKAMTQDVLAVIATHYFGGITDIRKIKELASQVNAKVIEDSAQIDPVVAIETAKGDAVILSFGRGKAISINGGGAALFRSDFNLNAIDEKLEKQRKPGRLAEIKQVITALLNDLLLHPVIYWLPSSIPLLGIGKTVYPKVITTNKMTEFKKQLLRRVVSRSKSEYGRRSSIAQEYNQILKNNARIGSPEFVKKEGYAPHRFPVYLKNGLQTDDIGKLEKYGIVRMYPTGINRVPEVRDYCVNCDKDYANADWISRYLFTLPTHKWVTTRKLSKINTLLASIQS